MNQRIIFLLSFWLCCGLALASNTNPDTLAKTTKHVEAKPLKQQFSFPTLDAQLALQPEKEEDNDLEALLNGVGDGSQFSRVAKARAIVNEALSIGRFIQKLDSIAFQEFPVVLSDTISNVHVAIVFDSLRLYPEYAQLAITIGMDIPQQKVGGQPGETLSLYFGSPNVKFSRNGAFIGETLVGLYADVAMDVGNDKKFGFVLRAFHEHGSGANVQDLGTYIKIDCDGFVEMGLEADVLFSRNWIKPVDGNGDVQATGRVKTHIQTVINDWNNLLVDVSLPNFALTAYDDLAFNISNAVFDFSDFRNSPNVNFPEAYAQQNLLPSNPNLWRGVYIKNLQVMLPKQFKDKNCQPPVTNAPGGPGQLPGNNGGSFGQMWLGENGEFALELEDDPLPRVASTNREVTIPLKLEEPPVSNCRITVGVNDLLIDPNGVSGKFYAENVLDLDKGSMDGWRFSVEDVSVEVVLNQVVGFGFGGEVGIPIAKKTQPFGYDAFVNIPNKEYNFTIMTRTDLSFPVFEMGTVNIDSASYIQVTATPSKFVPVAVLHGSASISARFKDPGAPPDGGENEAEKKVFEVAGLSFNGLRLATTQPYIGLVANGGSLGFSSGLKLVNFPISISDPKLESMPNSMVKLGVNISFNMMSQGDGGFAATTKIGLVGKLKNEGGVKTWQYERFDLDSIAVIIDIDPIYLEGSVYIFRNDPVFGKGFQGSLYADVLNGKFELTANAIFGKTTTSANPYKYWYFDALVESSLLKIPIFPPLFINGFGGGAYHHMKMDSFQGSGTGTTSSGVKYVPNNSVKLGLKAIVALTAEADTFDGIATLEIVFGQGMSLQEIMFYGKAEIVSPKVNQLMGKFSASIAQRLDKLPLVKEQVDAQDKQATNAPNNSILASLFLRMNFEDGFELQGTFRAKLMAAEGIIVGEGSIDLLISTPQNKWHLYLGGYNNGAIMGGDGAPLYPVNVTIIYDNDPGPDIIVTAGAYFLVGNDIPGPPPLEPRAAAFFGSSSNNNNRGDLSGKAAQGSGFAFGAFAFLDFEYVKEYRNNGNKKKWVRIQAGIGFDVSFLKYQKNTYCSISGTSPHGHLGWRATGRIWAFVDVVGGKWGIVPVPNMGIGVLLEADVPKPSYFRGQLRVKFGPFNIPVTVKIGKECGPPYVN